MNKLLISFFSLFSLTTTHAQTYTYTPPNLITTTWSLGAEYRYNPKEQDLGVRYDYFKNKGSWNIGFTYTFGMGAEKHDNGFGFSAGYRYNYQNSLNSSVYTGINASLLFGKNKAGNETALRPAIELGYQGVINNHYLIVPGVSYGYGIDLSKEKEKTTDYGGGRFLPGLAIAYRF